MRKNKRNHYAKFAIWKYYPWPTFDVLNVELYMKQYKFRFVK